MKTFQIIYNISKNDQEKIINKSAIFYNFLEIDKFGNQIFVKCFHLQL